MRPIKLTVEQFGELAGYAAGKVAYDYEEYGRRYELQLREYNERSITLAELDAIIESRLLKDATL